MPIASARDCDYLYRNLWRVAVVEQDVNNHGDIFVHDRETGKTVRVSQVSDGADANGASGDPIISGGGRCVAFGSDARNLVSNDTNNSRDVFVSENDLSE